MNVRWGFALRLNRYRIRPFSHTHCETTVTGIGRKELVLTCLGCVSLRQATTMVDEQGFALEL